MDDSEFSRHLPMTLSTSLTMTRQSHRDVSRRGSFVSGPAWAFVLALAWLSSSCREDPPPRILYSMGGASGGGFGSGPRPVGGVSAGRRDAAADAGDGGAAPDAGRDAASSGELCSLLVQDCPTNQACYPIRTGGTRCLPAGGQGEGGLCTVDNSTDCVRGTVCVFASAAANGYCRALCRVGAAAQGCFRCVELDPRLSGVGWCEP